jgi:hypothetical protein
VRRGSHLLDVLGSCGIERRLGYRLFAAPKATNASLQRWIRTQEGIDLDGAVSPTKQDHENINQLVLWAIFDRLLLDLDARTDSIARGRAFEAELPRQRG